MLADHLATVVGSHTELSVQLTSTARSSWFSFSRQSDAGLSTGAPSHLESIRSGKGDDFHD